MEQALDALRQALAAAQCRRRAARLTLHYPLYPAPRVAVLGLELAGPAGVRCFPEWTPEELEGMRPQALAGWWHDLAEVAQQVRSGRLALPDLQYPILVFSRPGAAPLPQRCHSLLWDWLRVPAFVQVRNEKGELLAFECSARDGFHLAPGADAAAVPLVLSPRPCPCGNPAPVYHIETALQSAAG